MLGTLRKVALENNSQLSFPSIVTVNGQIKTKAEIKKAIKEVQEKKSKAEEIQEAEIVEDKVPYTYVKKMISELSTKLKDLDTFAKENEGLSKEDYNKLQEIIRVMK